MIVEKKKCKIAVTDLLLIAVAVCFLIGIRSWFSVCAPMAENFMSCHWAGEVLKGLSILLLALSAVHLALPNGWAKLGIDASLLGIWVFAICVPGRIVSLCQNAGMHCRAQTQPATLAFGVAGILLLLADAALYLSKGAGRKHKRQSVEA